MIGLIIELGISVDLVPNVTSIISFLYKRLFVYNLYQLMIL